MKYNFFFIFLVIFLHSCTSKNMNIQSDKPILEKFSNSGFTLIFNEKLYKDKIINKKLNDRDLLLFQKNLKKGSSVKIKNLLNEKSIIAKVGNKAKYPSFYNSVISIRIAKELEIDFKEPYIIIEEINNNSSFIAKKTKTFEEEKQVANKAPVETISVNDLNETNKKIKRKDLRKFKYIIKIADFYYENTTKDLTYRIKSELGIEPISIKKINKNQFRVFLGPYSSLKTLQNAYNSIEILGFENIEFIRYE